MRIKNDLKQELNNTQFVDENDGYESESDTKCYKNIIYTAHLHCGLQNLSLPSSFWSQYKEIFDKSLFQKSCCCYGKSPFFY